VGWGSVAVAADSDGMIQRCGYWCAKTSLSSRGYWRSLFGLDPSWTAPFWGRHALYAMTNDEIPNDEQNDEIGSTNDQMHALTRCLASTLSAFGIRHYSFVIYDEA
jgi:hypothetical protein